VWYNRLKRHKRRRKRGEIAVTVCVAAICQGAVGPVIFGASDRMITAGDIQFEPQQTKVYPLTNSIIAQVAGDASIQAQIMRKVSTDVNKRIEAKPTEWWDVRDVAELYRHYYEELRSVLVEHDILVPLLLDRNTWLIKQREMNSELVIKIATELMNYEWEKTAVIFSGIDPSGAHIYVVRDGTISCHDSVGFAAIGAGEWHADSQMMFARHSRFKPIPETLLLVYSAKRRAEVAPGVGKGTDMFAIGPSLGSFAPITEEIEGLEKIYLKEQERHEKAAINARGEVAKYVEEIARRTTEKTQETKPTDINGETPSDKEGL
jgi:hypothetical protein